MPPASQNHKTHFGFKLNGPSELKDSLRLKPCDLEEFEESGYSKPANDYKMKIIWSRVAIGIYYHLAAFYGIYLLLTSSKRQTIIWWLILHFMTGFGTTAGLHRLWSHRCYKAKWPLRLILVIFSTLAFLFPVYDWVRDHRTHHKHCDTDADPHNSNRGFFFSHMGWLYCRKHPDVIRKGQRIDLSDLEQDPFVMFQKRHFFKITFVINIMIPMLVPVYFWGENLSDAYHVAVTLRTLATMHIVSLINSAGHKWGDRPYVSSIRPTENLTLSIFALGEGWHNYHHVFPWDYKTAELGSYAANVSTAFIDFFALFGWAYDLKTVPMSMVLKRMKRTGIQGQTTNTHEGEVWGWGDENMNQKDLTSAVILKREQKSE